MNPGTLPSSGYLGYCSFYAAGPSHREPGDGMSGATPTPFYNQYSLLQPPEHASLKQLLGQIFRAGKVFPSNSLNSGSMLLWLEEQGHSRFLETPVCRAAVLA